jgi:hypothetical protein
LPLQLPRLVLELRAGTGRRDAVSASLPGQKVTCNAPPAPPTKTAPLSVDPPDLPTKTPTVSVDSRRGGASLRAKLVLRAAGWRVEIAARLGPYASASCRAPWWSSDSERVVMWPRVRPHKPMPRASSVGDKAVDQTGATSRFQSLKNGWHSQDAGEMVRDKSHSPNFADLRASKKYRLISPSLAQPSLASSWSFGSAFPLDHRKGSHD